MSSLVSGGSTFHQYEKQGNNRHLWFDRVLVSGNFYFRPHSTFNRSVDSNAKTALESCKPRICKKESMNLAFRVDQGKQHGNLANRIVLFCQILEYFISQMG